MPTMAVLSFSVSGICGPSERPFGRSTSGSARGEHRHLGQRAQRRRSGGCSSRSARSRCSTSVRMARRSVPAIHDRVRRCAGALRVGQHAWNRGRRTGASPSPGRPGPASGTRGSPPRGLRAPRRCRGTMASISSSPSFVPDVDAPGAAHADLRGARAARASRPGRTDRPGTRVRAVFCRACDRVPSSLSPIDPGRNPEQVPCMTRRRSVLNAVGASRDRRRPSGSRRTRRSSVVPPRSSSRRCSGVPASTSSGSSCAMAPRRPEPAADADEALQPGDGRIGVDALDVALAAR